MKWEVITAPTARPVSYEQVRNHLRLDGFDDQAYLEETIDDVAACAETEMACSLCPQILTATYWDEEVKTKVVLPRGPVIAITSVTAGGVELDASAYTLKRVGSEDFVEFSASVASPLVIVYQAGYTAIPKDIRRAILLHVGAWYENREAVGKAAAELPFGSQAIYSKHRRSSLVG